MKPLERNFMMPISDFILVLLLVQKIILPPINHGNFYLNGTFAFLSVSFLFLGVCYFSPLYYKKWYRLLGIIVGFVLFISFNTEALMFYYQFGIGWGLLHVLAFNHFLLFIPSLIILLTNYKIKVPNKLIWSIVMFFIPVAGSFYFLIWRMIQLEKSPEQPIS